MPVKLTISEDDFAIKLIITAYKNQPGVELFVHQRLCESKFSDQKTTTLSIHNYENKIHCKRYVKDSSRCNFIANAVF